MPKIYLSPSTQEFNDTVLGASEEQLMNLLADYLTPYLYSNGISFKRNSPYMKAKDNIEDSNRGKYDFHLALHSNASPEGKEGQKQGIEIYYFPESYEGLKMAELLKKNLSTIYPWPDKIEAIPTTSLGEVDKVKAPAVLLETAYHDNEEDARWLYDNLPKIAEKTGASIAEYFSIPFTEPIAPLDAEVSAKGGRLNLRELPSLNSKIYTSMPDGQRVVVLGLNEPWATVSYRDFLGFAGTEYLNFN